jgi:hypothetical protein
MKNFWKFNWKQSLHKVKQQWLVIFAISLSLSMIAGLGYYNDAVQKHQFENSFEHISDFEINHFQYYDLHNGAYPRLDYTANFQNHDEAVSEIINKTAMALEGAYKYGLLTCENGIWCEDSYDDYEPTSYYHELDYKKDVNASEIKFALFDDTFYSSNRFATYFKIVEGRAPIRPNEIIVDESMLAKYGINVGETVNLTLQVGRIMDGLMEATILKGFQLKEIKIVGKYIPTQTEYRLDQETFSYSYTYEDYLANNTYKEASDSIDGPAIFSWYNFSGPDGMHPFQRLYYEIQADEEFGSYLSEAFTRSGYIISYDRSDIDFQDLNKYQRLISQQSKNLSIYMPWDVNFVDILGVQLQNSYAELQSTRLFIQLLNLPLIFFAILITNNLSRTNDADEIRELILLQGRGFAKKDLKRMILIRSLMIGFISASIGLAFGFGTFFGYKIWLKDVFMQAAGSRIVPYISQFSVFLTCAVGVLIQLSSNASLFSKYSKSKINSLNQEISQEFNSEEYEAAKIFKEEQVNRIDEHHTAAGVDYEGEELVEEAGTGKKSPMVRIKGITQLLFIFVPIILNFVMIIGLRVSLSDSFTDLFSTLLDSVELVQFLTLIGLFFAIDLGVLILIKKFPGIMYNLTKSISFLFVKSYNSLVALELLRTQKWRKIMVYVAIFSGILFAANMLYNSQYMYENMEGNIDLGGDARIEFSHPENLDLSLSEIINIEDSLQKISINNSNSVNAVSSCIIQESVDFYNGDHQKIDDTDLFVLDYGKYTTTMVGQEYLPYSQIEKELMAMQNSRQNYDGENVPLWASRNFLLRYNLAVGDTIAVDLELASSDSSSEIYTVIGILQGECSYLPGINTELTHQSIIIDTYFLNALDLNLSMSSFIQLIDLDYVSSSIISEYNQEIRDTLEEHNLNPIITINAFAIDEPKISSLSIEFGTSEFYYLVLTDLIIIAILLTVELAINEFLIIKDARVNRMLESRGINERSMLLIVITEISIIYWVAIGIGAIFGALYSSILTWFNQTLILANTDSLSFLIQMPLFFDFRLFFEITGLTYLFSLSISILFHYIHKNKNNKRHISTHHHETKPIMTKEVA